MSARLPESLVDANRVFCFAGGIGWDIASALAPLGEKLRVDDRLEPLIDAIVAQAQPGDQILVMSNGGFGGIHAKLLRALEPRA